jgi:hypothetical protein
MCLSWTGLARADAVTDWNEIAIQTIPFLSTSLDTTYVDYLSSHGLAEDNPGVAVGQQAAAGIIALRANDGSFPPNPTPFTGGTDPGVWRPTPPTFAPMVTVWVATVMPFALRSPDQFRAPPPPALTSHRYTENYNEVKALGAFSNSARTPEQTDLALFWAANYQALWNQALRDLVDAHVHNIAESARLFALANLAMADAVITVWDSKVHYLLWRPVTAIQEGDNDGNPETVGDPTWLPLIATPFYPDYTSGANGVTAAVTRSLALFFGTDHMNFSLTTNNPAALQQTRTYSRFSEAAVEVVNARIYEGIHFRFADVEARKQGRHVAQWVFSHFLRPMGDDSQKKGAQ